MQIGRTIVGVGTDFKRFFWPQKHWLKAARLGVLALVLIVGGRLLFAEPATDTPEDTTPDRAVTLVTPAEVAAEQAGTFVGTVRAVSEAQIQNEVAGRVTSVAVRPGQAVAAGTVIATLENSAQQAAVLQAEGSYESALAAAAQSQTGVESAQAALQQAENTAVAAVRGAAGTYNSTVINTIDIFFSNPDSRIPGVRIDSSYTSNLNSARIELAQLLPALTQTGDALTVDSDLPAAISEAKVVGERVIQILDWLIADVRSAAASETLNGQAVTSFSSTLTAARSSVVSAQGSLNSAATGLTQAEASLTQAQQAAQSSDTTVSAADAQVKTALGSLRAAQAQLAKTILRTPIAGTVNDVSVNTGDFIGAFTQVAEVANNGSLEISFFVTEAEAATLQVGQELVVNGTASGTIVSIAPAVNQATQKTEVRAAVSEGVDLTNGSTVRVTPKTTDTNESTLDEQPIRLPLTAVRFTASEGSVFIVHDNTLVLTPVTLGRIQGSTVVIVSGITATDAVVADARGLTEGQRVTVQSN